jgi:methylated-DNA-[protein]-cysteine S-methyltransferase
MRRKATKNQEWTVCLPATPVGNLTLHFTHQGLGALEFSGNGASRTAQAADPPPPQVQAFIDATVRELTVYFAGAPADFAALTLDPEGTRFQRRVWQELQKIPRGQTISYKELARRVGQPEACRAVGQANGRNPIPVIIPCHRVISANGTLGGYSSGLERKRWLLRHEGAM